MSKLSFQLRTEIEKNARVLTWRLPKSQVTKEQPVPEQENLKKPSPVFGRRTVQPVVTA